MHNKYLQKLLLVLFWALIAVLFFTVINGMMRHMNFSKIIGMFMMMNGGLIGILYAFFALIWTPIYTLAYTFIFVVEYPLASVWLCILIPLHIATGKQKGSIAFFSVKNFKTQQA